ncbi:MAG: ATP-binding cassette domain-containing protein [Bdellovibrionales bacterium]|nr:ATP-binding cassette domain-containing protein [Bdellovibrionales bacterium]
MIQLDQVRLQFKNRTILDEVSVTIPKQSAFTIVGPSGKGKSVLLKLVAGLITPSAGTVTVQSDKVSMLFQKNALFDSFTILENLLIPLAETLGIEGSVATERSMAMLDAVGLAHAADLHPDEISGGMQKRLGIARALIIEPEVILYDEPTAGLDPITSRSIADLILDLHRKNKTTLMMVTNDLQRAYQISDTIAFCNHQRLRILGSPDQVRDSQDAEIKRFIYANAFHLGSKKEPEART